MLRDNIVRIPGIESELTNKSNVSLDPKIIHLLEKIAKQPILLQKITLNQGAPISLSSASKSPISQLLLPINTASQLQALVTSGAKLSLELVNGRIVVTLNSKDTPAIQLSFQQARLVGKDVLQLTQPTLTNLQQQTSSHSQQIPNPTVPQHADNQPHAKQTTATNSGVRGNESTPLIETVKSLLKLHQANSPKVAQSLATLFSSQQQLLKTLSTSQIRNKLTPLIQLNKQGLQELMQKSETFLPKNTLSNQLVKIIQTISHLKGELEFSKTNPRLNIDQRIKQSGNFLESNLSKLSPDTRNLTTKSNAPPPLSGYNQKAIAKQESNGNNALPRQNNEKSIDKKSIDRQQATTPGSIASPTLVDIKSTSLQLKYMLQQILPLLSSKQSQPVHIARIMLQLAQQPEFLSRVPNLQSMPPSAQATSSIPNDDLLANQQNSFFKSKSLQEFVWNEQNLKVLKSTLHNKQQEALLLNQQRKLLTEMLSDVTKTLSKIESNQLLSVRQEAAQLQQVLFELPIYRFGQVDSFEILLAQESDKKENSVVKSWTVTVRFDLEPLGPMFAKVSLKNQRISTHFFAQKETTASLLNQHLDYLKQSLIAVGVDIEELKGTQGIVPEELIRNEEHSVDLRV